jgi:prevent-host-death family protein
MVAYTKEEMVGITELTKSLGKYLDVVTSSALNKLAIVRRNKPEAVIVPIEEYERMRAATDYLEDMGIAEMLKERVFNRTTPAKMISHEEMKEYFKKRGIGDV